MKTWQIIFFLLISMVLALALTIGCGDDDDEDDDEDEGTDDDDATDDDTTDDDDDTTDDDDDDATGDDFTEAEANPGEWVWLNRPEMICRDGSPAGIGARLQDGATSLVIYLEGGGACFDVDTCADNPSKFGPTDFKSWADSTGKVGLFDSTNAANPTKDANFIYVPYCTGDLHFGNAPDGGIAGLDGNQAFVGYANITAMVDLVQPYFAGMTNVLFTGSSAGGFGSFLNYDQVAAAFAPQTVNYLNDSAPIFALDDALAPCMQLLVRFIWNVDPVVPAGCTDCLQVNGDGMSNLYIYMAQTYPAASFGLFSTTADETIRDFFGMGQNDCNGTTLIPADTYEDGLIDLRDNVFTAAGTGNWGTYFVDDSYHTIFGDPKFYTANVESTDLTAWIGDLINGTVADVGP